MLNKKGVGAIGAIGGLALGLLVGTGVSQYKIVNSVVPTKIVSPTAVATMVPTASPSATIVPTKPMSRYYFPPTKAAPVK